MVRCLIHWMVRCLVHWMAHWMRSWVHWMAHWVANIVGASCLQTCDEIEQCAKKVDNSGRIWPVGRWRSVGITKTFANAIGRVLRVASEASTNNAASTLCTIYEALPRRPPWFRAVVVNETRIERFVEKTRPHDPELIIAHEQLCFFLSFFLSDAMGADIA
jgi:hypothetical protein